MFAPSAPPPARALPQITWDAEAESRYVEDGYRITAFDSCASARTFIRGAAAAERLVVRLTDTSHCVWSNQTLGGASQNVVPIHGDMAVVTDGTMEWADNVTFQGVGGTHRLIIIRPFVAGRPCPSDAKWPNLTPASEFDFKFGNNTVFRSLNLFVYSPCFISFGNNNGSGVNGQIVGGRVTMTNQMTFNYRPMLVPNAHVVGYTTDMAFLREIATRRAPAA